MCNFSQLIIVISIINVLPLKNVICWENSFPICLVSGNKNVLTWQHHISYVFNKRLLLLIAVKCNNNDNNNNNNDSVVGLLTCDLSSYNYFVFLPLFFIRVNW